MAIPQSAGGPSGSLVTPEQPQLVAQPVPARRSGDHPQQHETHDLGHVDRLGQRRAIAADRVEQRTDGRGEQQRTDERQQPERPMWAPSGVQQPDRQGQSRRTDMTSDMGRCAVELGEHERPHALTGDHHATPRQRRS